MNLNSLKLDDFEILASMTSKMTSKPQQPLPSGFSFQYIFEISGFH